MISVLPELRSQNREEKAVFAVKKLANIQD